MKRTIFLFVMTMASPFAQAQAQQGVMVMDTRIVTHLTVDEFEWSDIGSENEFSWDMDVSVGGDFHKAWIKTRGERGEERADRSELQLLYSKAILPFWDLQAGVRRDFESALDRNWAAISISGLAPYFFDVEAELFLAEGGQTSLRARAEYELLLTQQLILSPELEIVAYGSKEEVRLIDSGLSEIGLSVRLRYEVRRELAPYVSLGWHRLYGGSREMANAAGHSKQDTVLVVGIRAWY